MRVLSASITLGPAYNEFGYKYPAITSNFFHSEKKKSLLININVKVGPPKTSPTCNEQVLVN